ncbi:MAG: hypothetical protein K0Q46_6162 [Rhodococcus erythropolis]|jgi:uncharacterized protein (DUF488 family)|nr:hypothetical protein [Rhodococcus erythropolis]
MSQQSFEPEEIWTLGHGLKSIEDFLETATHNGIQSIVDVRSTPASTRAPQYNAHALRRSLAGIGVSYVPMGAELGGRPPEDEFYDAEGHVLYRHLAESARFRSGINRLESGARRFRVAILCSETDPTRCHRNLLIGRVLRERGHRVSHILSDGRTVAFDDQLVSVVGLPGFEEDQWRSLVQVRQGPLLNDSFSG